MMIAVRSTAIQAVEYDELTQDLTVFFTNGLSADHYEVPAEVVQNLVEAASPGGYYNARIKGQF